MRKTILAVALSLVANTVYAADPIEGLWKTQPDDGSYGHILIEPCGSNFCGIIYKTFNSDGEYQSENLGKMMVIDMEPQGNGEYHGEVWRPSNNKVYVGKISLSGDQMDLRGCILGGLLCSKQEWKRLTQDIQ